MKVARSLTELIGRTPLLRLERAIPGGVVLGKWESFNPLPPRPRTGRPGI